MCVYGNKICLARPLPFGAATLREIQYYTGTVNYGKEKDKRQGTASTGHTLFLLFYCGTLLIEMTSMYLWKYIFKPGHVRFVLQG